MPHADPRHKLRDVAPPARLATQKSDHSQFTLLETTVRKTLYSFGRFPLYLREGDFIPMLIEEGITECLPLLGRSDDDLIAGAKSVCRRLIHRERIETRWWETTPEGKRVHRSKSTWRVSPLPAVPEEGDEVGIDPIDDIPCNMSGRLLPASQPRGRNAVEDFLSADLDREWQLLRILDAVGADDYRFLLDYVERKHTGSAIPASDRDRFHRLKKKIRNKTTNGRSVR